MKHDQSRWRFWKNTNAQRHCLQWVMESDNSVAMAIMELPFFSQWHKERHPDWEKEFQEQEERIQANADLIQSAPFMLQALLLARDGDTSLIEEAIKRATGELDWLGNVK